ncbi:DNA circularization N-terminal domain-containing protein [Burkholderia sp. BCC0398]|uniref:DNA circularization protein n=1 Tax=Burkholderia sp. BCC0398 TaxID=2676297 RepID=UPI00158B7A62|nr:DNA circularization N-terminal domain-containing protein [Burkholderia sp. BCC0398]
MSVTTGVVIAGSIGGVAASASDLVSGVSSVVNGVSNLLSGNWQSLMRGASYGGVPFAVEAARTAGGRRNAVHDYPYRDEVWVEDLGKLPRQFNLVGFLVEDSLIYGGGSVIGQRDRMFNVCEAAGPQTLVHPTFGTVENVNCLNVEFMERKDLGRVVEVMFTFIRSGLRIYPKAVDSTQDVVSAAADALNASSLLDFVKNTASAIQGGAAVVQSAVSAAVGIYQLGVTAVNDVKRFLGAVSTLSGNFGRLFGGGNSGYLGSNQKAPAGTTVSMLIQNDTVLRAAVSSTGAALQSAAAAVVDTASFSAAAVSFVRAVAASASDPADAIRMLSSMATYSPNGITSPSAIGNAMAQMQSACGALFRRAVLAQLATTVSAYQPASQQDSQAVMANVTAMLDAEIEIAGDAGDDSSYTALRALRQSVVADLQARGAGIAPATTFSFATPMPALVLANRIYRDPARTDGLVQQADAVHPAFLPTSFQALAT